MPTCALPILRTSPSKLRGMPPNVGVPATKVKSAYTSQECSVCHSVDKKNRPDQQTFCCLVCGHRTQADLNASVNIKRRLGDEELRACKDRQEVKALLMKRHAAWKIVQGWP